MSEDTLGNSKWQPVVIMLKRGGRLECIKCGSLAVIVTGELDDDRKDAIQGVDYYCQACFLKALNGELA